MSVRAVLAAMAAFSGLLLGLESAAAQGTAFSYQGKLMDGGQPANGLYDFQFHLTSDPSGNGEDMGLIATNGITVNDGLFTVALDFGPGAFGGTNLWLGVDVRTNGASSFQTLGSLQPLTPTPYALFAEGANTLAGVLPEGGLVGSYSSQVSLTNPSNTFAGTFSGDGSGLTNLTANLSGSLVSGQVLITNGAVLNLLATTTPEAFGADPTGQHDSTAAFQAAVNYCEASTNRLFLAGRYLLSSTILITNGLVIQGPRSWDDPYYSISTSTNWTIHFTGATNLFYAPPEYSVNGLCIRDIQAVGPGLSGVAASAVFLDIAGRSSVYPNQHLEISGVGLNSWGGGVLVSNTALVHGSDCWFQDVLTGYGQYGASLGEWDNLTVTGVSSNGIYLSGGHLTLLNYQPLVTGFAINTCPTNLWGPLVCLNGAIEGYGLSWSNWPVQLAYTGVGTFPAATFIGGRMQDNGLPGPMLYTKNVRLLLSTVSMSFDGNGNKIFCDDQLVNLIKTDNEWPGYQVTNSPLATMYYAADTWYNPLILDSQRFSGGNTVMPSAIGDSFLYVRGNSTFNGKVGIGTNKPQADLEVNGDTLLRKTYLAPNGPATWPAAAPGPGYAMFANSNGAVYLLTSAPTGTAWTKTNLIASP